MGFWFCFLFLITIHDLHPSYNQGSGAYPNDIAVLLLETPLDLTSSSKVAAYTFASAGDNFDWQTCVISGWGRLSGNQGLPDILQKVDITALSNTACRQSWGWNVNDGHICVNDANAGTGSCNGDSGGPMRCGNKIVGLTSWGASGCLTSMPSVYTRVSHFQSFLEGVTGGQ